MKSQDAGLMSDIAPTKYETYQNAPQHGCPATLHNPHTPPSCRWKPRKTVYRRLMTPLSHKSIETIMRELQRGVAWRSLPDPLRWAISKLKLVSLT
jgi:hypothetical protein